MLQRGRLTIQICKHWPVVYPLEIRIRRKNFLSMSSCASSQELPAVVYQYETSCRKLHEMRPSLEAVDAFVAFSSLSADIAALKEEFPLYTAAAEDVDPSYDPLLFWKQHESTFPFWSRTARHILLLQPSSAASEQVFPLLRNSLSEHQHSSLQDYNFFIEVSLMLQYNKC